MHVLIAALHSPSTPTGICRYAANLAQCLVGTSEISRVTLVIGAWQKSCIYKIVNTKAQQVSQRLEQDLQRIDEGIE